MFKHLFMILKGDFNGHPFRGNQWSIGGVGYAEGFSTPRNKRTTTVGRLLRVAFNNDKELMAEFKQALKEVNADVAAGKESHLQHIKNLKYIQSGKAKRPAFTKDRLKLHNKIINSILKDADSFLPKEGEKPEVIFLGGRGGAGKSNFNSSRGHDSGVYSDTSHLLLDPDKVKSMMPEYNPEKAYLVHRESAIIYDKLVSVARRRGLNVALDLTMRHPLGGVVNRFKKSGYKTQAHFMHLSPEGAVVRAASRWATEVEKLPNGTMSKRGRLVPPEVILEMTTNEKNFDAVARQVDSSAVWANDRPKGVGPRLISKKDSTKKFDGFSMVFKANPYHGPDGRFASHSGAHFVSSWGKSYANIDAKNNSGKNALASQQHLGKVKELSHVLGKHVRGGGTLSDAFGKSVLAQAQLHASGVKAYGTHAISPVKDSYRTSLDAAIAGAFAKSNLSPKEKSGAGIPLTPEESEAIAKSKEYDKKMYSQKMKGKKLSELPALFATSSAAFTQHGIDSAEYKKTKAKLNKAILMAQKHGATDEELATVAMDHQAKRDKAVADAKEAAQAALHEAIKKSNLTEDGSLLDSVNAELATTYAGVLTTKDLESSLVNATKSFNEGHQSARDKLSDAYSAYQPFKQDKKKGVTWDTLAASSGVPKEVMKKTYDEYQKAYKEVSEQYGEFAATKAVAKGKELYAAKKTTGVTPISDPVQLSAKPAGKSLGEVLGGTPNKSTAPAKTTDIPQVAKGPMAKPATKEEALDAAKALGSQYYLLKEGKYASTVSPASHPELSAAHSLYQQAKEHYVSLGGKLDDFSSVSMNLKTEAKGALAKAKEAEEAVKSTHKNAVQESASALEQAGQTYKPGSKGYKEAMESHAAVVAAASKYLTQDAIQAYEGAGKSSYKELMVKEKDASLSAVKSASASLHAAMLKHKDKNHEEVLKAASNLNGVLKVNGKVLSKEELSSAKSLGKQIAVSNQKAANALGVISKKAPSVAKAYDKNSKSFKEVTDDHNFKEHGKAQVSKLSSSEKHVLKGYTGSAFTKINKEVGAFGTAKMKGLPGEALTPNTKNSMEDMDKVFSKTTLGANVNLRRNMAQKYFWEQLGFSLDDIHKMSDSDLNGLAGRVYKETAYSSTSTRSDFTGAFSNEIEKTGGLSLRIRAGEDMPGIHAKSISHHEGEDEVVLPRGTTYVIRSVKRASSGSFLYDVHVDMIGAFPDQL